MIICDDCLNALLQIKSETIDMVYLDPPFFTQKVQRLRDSKGVEYAFSDVWDTRKDYLEYMEKRIREVRRVLKNTGSVFLQCDDAASHYLRIVLIIYLGKIILEARLSGHIKDGLMQKRVCSQGIRRYFFIQNPMVLNST